MMDLDPTRMPFVVYADFNCPFCYAYNYRLRHLGITEKIDWRLIQHVPQASGARMTQQDVAELTSEIATLRRRAPDIPISMLSIRPNSGRATRQFLEALHTAPELAPAFRGRVYDALWVHGEDISRRSVLDRIWNEVGLPTPQPSTDLDATMQTWQRQWEGDRFDRRIPSMMDGHGMTLLGLPTLSRLSNFMAGRPDDEDPGLVCNLRPRQRIAVLTDTPELATHIESSLRGLAVVQPLDVVELDGLLDRHTTDLLLIDLDALLPPIAEIIDRLRKVQHPDGASLVFISREPTPQLEVEAFERGATDFLPFPMPSLVAQARLMAHLQNRFAAEQLRRLASVDHLTGVDNRREFDRSLHREWNSCRRLSQPLAVLMIDIDHFKQFNDTFGHGEGDACLRTVAQALRSALERPSDYLARYGGEEFAAILSNTDAAGAQHVGQRVSQAVRDLGLPHPTSTAAKIVTVSIGVKAMVPGGNASASELLHMADLALYKAKMSGRNRVVSM